MTTTKLHTTIIIHKQQKKLHQMIPNEIHDVKYFIQNIKPT